jgi:hypothetical protein
MPSYHFSTALLIFLVSNCAKILVSRGFAPNLTKNCQKVLPFLKSHAILTKVKKTQTGAVNSAVECLPYKQKVTGSNPVPPIKKKEKNELL